MAELDALIALPRDESWVPQLRQRVDERIARMNVEATALTEEILELVGREEGTDGSHWRYKQIAARFLRVLIRRDEPLDARLASFMMVSRIVLSCGL